MIDTIYDLARQTSARARRATPSMGLDLHFHSSVRNPERGLYLIRRLRLGEKEP